MSCCANCPRMERMIRRIIAETPAPTPAPTPEPRTTQQLTGIHARVSDLKGGILPMQTAVPFTYIDSSTNPNITHDNNGKFIITKPGTYLVDWQLVTDGTDGSEDIRFFLCVDGLLHSQAGTPNVTGQLCGSALLHVQNVPYTVELKNMMEQNVTMANEWVQGNITIVGLS